jgi:uncharacterized protein (DUF1778 family)
MKTISVSVSPDDYEAFRRAAKTRGTPIAQLIREAMVHYRAEKLVERVRLTAVPVFAGHRSVRSLPSRHQVYAEVFERRSRARK